MIILALCTLALLAGAVVSLHMCFTMAVDIAQNNILLLFKHSLKQQLWH